jgi:hypothetical protein
MFTGQRRQDWAERMNFAIREHRTLPYIWGQSDCGVLFSDVVWAMTDEDPMLAFGRWTSELSALRAVVLAGVSSVKEYLDRELETVSVALARRGDVGYCTETQPLSCPAVIVGSEAISRDHNGWVAVPLSRLSTVYRIG